MASTDLRIEPMTSPDDVAAGFNCTVSTFGHQTQDGIWMAMNPGWDTASGSAAATKRFVDRWASATRDRNGDLNTIFLKATLPDDASGRRVVAGFAIWQQVSMVEGHGDVPAEDLRKVMDLEALYPGDEAEQRFLVQADRSLHRRRIEVVKEKAAASPPAAMVLDLCVVDPAFQRRGVAQRLVRWGLDEAERRGGLEAITEASSMGRGAYVKMGFRPEGEVVYDVDDEFRGRDLPSNLFMRTALLVISLLDLLTRPQPPFSNANHETALKHKRTAPGADLCRLQLGVPRPLSALRVRAVPAHDIVQARAAGDKAARPAPLGIVAALDQAHELAHGVAVVPRPPARALADQP
ncbi:hypothetical protein FZEAL_773, partial [Fusarium zealandicum]